MILIFRPLYSIVESSTDNWWGGRRAQIQSKRLRFPCLPKRRLVTVLSELFRCQILSKFNFQVSYTKIITLWPSHTLPLDGTYLQFVSTAVWPASVINASPPPHISKRMASSAPISFCKGGNGANSRFNRHIESRLTSSRAMWSQISEQLPVFRVLIPIKATHPMVHCTAGCYCKRVSLHMKRGFD